MAKITKEAIEALPVGGRLWEGGIYYQKGKRGGSWWITYYVGTKQMKERVGKDGEVTKTDAKKALRSRQGDIVQGRFDVAKTEKPILFSEFFKDFIKRHAKPSKKSWADDQWRGDKHLLPEFGNLPLNEITPWKIEKYKSKRVKEGAAKATVNRELALLKTVFSKAVLWDRTRENPVKKVKMFRENNRRDRYLTEEEAHRLIEAAEGPVKYFIIVALNTGMRKSEILGLKWRDISYDQGIITLRDDKAGSGRKAPMNAYLKESLQEIPRFDETYVFPGNVPGKPLMDIRDSFDKAVRKAKIPNPKKVTPHTLRHTYASWLAMEGIDLFTIQYLMGHKTITMTQRYAHLAPDHKRQAAETISRKFTRPEQDQKSKIVAIKKAVNFTAPVSD